MRIYHCVYVHGSLSNQLYSYCKFQILFKTFDKTARCNTHRHGAISTFYDVNSVQPVDTFVFGIAQVMSYLTVHTNKQVQILTKFPSRY